jgi:hypothetical protein
LLAENAASLCDDPLEVHENARNNHKIARLYERAHEQEKFEEENFMRIPNADKKLQNELRKLTSGTNIFEIPLKKKKEKRDQKKHKK